jgi:hypothetical protein
MARKGERALNIGSASPLGDFGNPNDLKVIDVYERRRCVAGNSFPSIVRSKSRKIA